MRKLRIGERVRVYRNLRAGKDGRRVYSVVGSDGRVAAHVERIVLTDMEFVVRPAGQAKVRREHRKNVHAFVVGTYKTSAMGTDGNEKLNWPRITYNPYEDAHFVSNQVPRHYVKGASCCVLNQYGVNAVYTEEV